MSFNEEYYGIIAQLLNDIVPVDCRRIHLCAEVGEESIATYFYYLTHEQEFMQGGTICDDLKVPKEKSGKKNI